MGCQPTDNCFLVGNTGVKNSSTLRAQAGITSEEGPLRGDWGGSAQVCLLQGGWHAKCSPRAAIAGMPAHSRPSFQITSREGGEVDFFKR